MVAERVTSLTHSNTTDTMTRDMEALITRTRNEPEHPLHGKTDEEILNTVLDRFRHKLGSIGAEREGGKE